MLQTHINFTKINPMTDCTLSQTTTATPDERRLWQQGNGGSVFRIVRIVTPPEYSHVIDTIPSANKTVYYISLKNYPTHSEWVITIHQNGSETDVVRIKAVDDLMISSRGFYQDYKGYVWPALNITEDGTPVIPDYHVVRDDKVTINALDYMNNNDNVELFHIPTSNHLFCNLSLNDDGQWVIATVWDAYSTQRVVRTHTDAVGNVVVTKNGFRQYEEGKLEVLFGF
jgi:hypothetical protein